MTKKKCDASHVRCITSGLISFKGKTNKINKTVYYYYYYYRSSWNGHTL